MRADLSCSSIKRYHSKRKKKRYFPASTYAGIKGFVGGKNAAPLRNQAEVILNRCNESEGSTMVKRGKYPRLGAPGEVGGRLSSREDSGP